MQLHLSTWREVETYLKHATGIIIPIGSTEQHGPNGLIGTDAICAETIARRLGEATGTLVTPPISVGMSQFHLGFAGSMTLQPATIIAVVKDYVLSLSRHGFRHFYFVNGHGANVPVCAVAFQEIYATISLGMNTNAITPRCRLKSWWDNPSVAALVESLYGQWEGFHATASEIAITKHVFPDKVREIVMAEPVALSDQFAINHNADEYYEADDFRRRFPDGRVASDPRLSRGEDGQRLIEAAVADMRTDLQAFLAEA